MTRLAKLLPNSKPDAPGGIASPPRWVVMPSVVLAMLITFCAIWLHHRFLTHAGGLWRDEVNTINLANFPTIRDIWANLQFDSFPLLWIFIVRALSFLGVVSDPAWRLMGFAVGIGIIAALWWTARILQYPSPYLALALLALNPVLICWGDTIRAYGFGMLLMILTLGLIWKIVEEPTRRHCLLATIAAIGSVQTLYYNSLLLFGICVGASLVALRRRHWRSLKIVIGLGAVAAATMIPYLSVFKRTAEWNMLVKTDVYDLGVFWAKINETLSVGGPWTIGLWFTLILGTLIIGVAGQIVSTPLKINPARRDLALFALTALVVSSVAYYSFLKFISYRTQAWHYLPLLAFVAITCEAVIRASLTGFPKHNAVCLVFSILCAALILPNAIRVSALRLTNVDLLAARLREIATKDDLVIVVPWHCGLTFARYSDSTIPWTTLPPMLSHTLHRYDLFKAHATMPDQTQPVRPVLEQIQLTLRAGHRVYLAGGLPFLVSGEDIPALGPAPDRNFGWDEGAYTHIWSKQAALFVQNHVLSAEPVEISSKEPLSGYEALPLIAVQGWRE